MNDNTILRIKVPAHLYESVKEQLTLKESNMIKERKAYRVVVQPTFAKKADSIVKAIYPNLKSDTDPKTKRVGYIVTDVESNKIGNALDKAGIEWDLYFAPMREDSAMNEAKKGKHNLGAGMELVKEKKNKTPKDGMKKMQNMNEVDQVEEGLVDMLRSVGDKLFYDILLNTPEGMSKEDRAKNIEGCLRQGTEKKKADPKIDRGAAIVACLEDKGWRFGRLGADPRRRQSAMGGTWDEGKKERTLDELKKAKDMLEMKIKKMEESLNEKTGSKDKIEETAGMVDENVVADLLNKLKTLPADALKKIKAELDLISPEAVKSGRVKSVTLPSNIE